MRMTCASAHTISIGSVVVLIPSHPMEDLDEDDYYLHPSQFALIELWGVPVHYHAKH
jgi:hypothetical protein